MESFDWNEQVAVVTGASAGIGASLAREVAQRGGKVVLAARRKDKLEQVARACGEASCQVVVADVTKRDDVAATLRAALARFGHVDAWVNNAGRGISRHVLDLSDDDLDAMIRDNVKSVLYGMQTAVPYFQKQRRGHLVNVSSMLARTPLASFRSAYSAAKHALNSLTENLRMDLAQDYSGIVVTTFMPGVVQTDFGLNALGGGVDSRSLPGAQSAEEVACMLADVLEQRRGGDVYSRPEAVDRVVEYVRALVGSR